MKTRTDYVLIIPNVVGKICMSVGAVTIVKKYAKPVIASVVAIGVVAKCAIDAKINSNSKDEYYEKYKKNVENAREALIKKAEKLKEKTDDIQTETK